MSHYPSYEPVEVGGQVRKLDHRTRYDERSLKFTIADRFKLNKAPRTHWYQRRVWLDQGREGACTGFGTAQMLSLAPRGQAVDNKWAQDLYKLAKTYDEYPGEDYEGSSVLGAMKAAQAVGRISAYYWATSLAEIIHGVSNVGPMVLGTNWYEGMFRPDSAGYVTVAGALMGGHCYCLGAVDLNRGFFRIDNSWGHDWGFRGSAMIRFSDVERLLHEQGEAALAAKKRQS